MAEPVTTITPEEAALLAKIIGEAPGGAHLTSRVQVAEPTDPRVAKILTLPPEVSFLTTRIPPPAPFYLAREDQLLVSIWNSVGGATIFLGARFLRPDGVIVPVVRTFNPTSDRALNSFTVPPTEGFLLGLHAGTATVSQPGQCYMSVLVNRSKAAAGTELHTLLGGYVTASQRPSWPTTAPRDPREGPGTIRSITGTQPAATAEVNEVVPTGARWRLLTFLVRLTNVNAAAARVPYLTIDDGTNILFKIAPPVGTGLGASITADLVWGNGLGYEKPATTTQQPETLSAGFPTAIILQPGWRIRTITDSLQTNDQYGVPQYAVEEWISI